MGNMVRGMRFDEERALYGVTDTDVVDCCFEGPADGESALKETHNIRVANSSFSLRYPLWHVRGFTINNIKMDEKARAAMWYDEDGIIENSVLHGIKVIRECSRITMRNCDIDSDEFAWKSSDIRLENCTVHSVYPFLDCRNVFVDGLTMTGKYSFQYVENMEMRNATLDTKDAFWHSKNVTVRDSTLKGEYLAWFSEGLTLINCKIIGTQPLCYCKGLKLIDCTMEGCDLSFEYSEVEGNVIGHVDSIKNPLSGRIEVDTLGELVKTGSVKDCHGEVVVHRPYKG